MAENRRQKIKDWLIGLNNPDAEKYLHSLNQMNLDDWEQKYRKDLRMFKGYSDLEKSSVPLRDRVRGEFDSYTDVPVWYLKGKAAKLGVTIDDVKKALGELEEERKYFEGRERRKKEIKDGFKWNFASDYSKQRYIDNPDASIFGKEGKFNPYSKEGQDELSDVILGGAAAVADFLPGLGGTFAGPVIRAGRNIAEGQDDEDVVSNFAADAGANAVVDFLPTLILNKIRKVAKNSVQHVEQYSHYKQDLSNSEKAVKEMQDAFKGIDIDKVDALDPKEISKLRKVVDGLPESPAKNDIKKILDSDPNDFMRETAGNLTDDLAELGINQNVGLNAGRIKGYVESMDGYLKANKKVPDAMVNPYNEKGQLASSGSEVIDIMNKKRALGQSMSKGEKALEKAYTTGTKVGPGAVKTADTYANKRQPVKSDDADRAVIEWYKENYAKDWANGFVPKGREDEAIMKAYRELYPENSTPRISDVF